jgi:lysophospholipase L1-like esterase
MTGLLVLSALGCFPPPESPKLELKDGDRIVWLGGTLVEREQKYGYWETALHAAFPKINFTLRNLGWSGDTVFGDSRAGFDTPKEGFKRLVDQTLALKPTVIFVCYGQNESFDGEAGLPKFEKGLETLLDALKPAKARIVLFSPTPFEADPVLPNPAERNAVLGKYRDVTRAVAGKRDLGFVDLFALLAPEATQSSVKLTDNGVHLTPRGYALVSTFFATDGSYSAIRSWPDTVMKEDRFVAMNKAVVAKNQLFFYRWRPQNETYLFGFRKHEQGKNAAEVAEFDPLVDKAEKEIERIKKDLFK